MKMAIDSSSFAKRYIQEIGSDKLDHLLQNLVTESGDIIPINSAI